MEMDTAIARLAMAGVRVDVDIANNDIFIAELPDGNRYRLVGARLLKMMDQGKLNIAGILEIGRKR